MAVQIKTGNNSFFLPDRITRRALVPASRGPTGAYSASAVRKAFSNALATPVSGSPLSQRLSPGGETCIIVSDKTRSYGVEIWLSTLLDACNEAGVEDDSITVLFATGAHAPQSQRTRERIVGAEAASRVKLVDHDCDDASNALYVGATSFGTAVRLNAIAVETKNLILTGVVTPHYYAGFSGGAKSILPGISARDTILRNHSLNLARGGGTHPLARVMNLDGNPIRDDMREASRFIDVATSINVVMGENGLPSKFYAGDVVEAHAAACESARSAVAREIRRPADWIIASCGGLPYDSSFYQAHKALDNAFQAVKPGGTIILAAECAEGLGPPGFREWFEKRDVGAIEAQLRRGYDVAGHTAMRTLEKTSRARVTLLSSLSKEEAGLMGMANADSSEDIFDIIDSTDGAGIILPQASTTVPFIKTNGEAAE